MTVERSPASLVKKTQRVGSTQIRATGHASNQHAAKNQRFPVIYGDRYRHGEPTASGLVESAVNQVVRKL